MNAVLEIKLTCVWESERGTERERARDGKSVQSKQSLLHKSVVLGFSAFPRQNKLNWNKSHEDILQDSCAIPATFIEILSWYRGPTFKMLSHPQTNQKVHIYHKPAPWNVAIDHANAKTSLPNTDIPYANTSINHSLNIFNNEMFFLNYELLKYLPLSKNKV